MPDGAGPLRVLLVEDNPSDARLVVEEMADAGPGRFEVTRVARLAEALSVLSERRFDAVLLDLALPDARGLETVQPVAHAAPDLPIVVLSGLKDEELALRSVKQGAQDYLIKGQGEGRLLSRSILYAIERKRWEQHIHHLAYYDSLTNVPNRRLLYDRLEQAMARSRRNKRSVALLFLDLDHFKIVNDTLGHSVGDRLLQEVARRLAGCVRESDTLARLGGDEFAFVLPNVTRAEDAALLAEKVQQVLLPPFTIKEQELYVGASIGISLYPADAEDVETLIRNADAAMFAAKQKGRNSHRFYSFPMNAKAKERLTLAGALRHAVARDELRLHYQPLVDVESSRVIGAEGLLRWENPSLGLLPPARFLRLAEETGLIVPIGEWAVRRCCEQGRAWRDALGEPLRMSVNISTRQFEREGLVEAVDSALQASGLEPHCLEIELTEDGVMQDTELAAATLRRLKEAGVRVSLDDFGTGCSSLSHLKRFPIDTLKIDRSLVNDVTRDAADAAIGSAIIGMAHGLGLEVIAEGVETADQLAFLRRRDCDRAQGFYFSRPLPAPELERRLRHGTAWWPAADDAMVAPPAGGG